ncbi:hypothetical protein GW17_00057938, partial [Ensete ventricosum]
KEKDQEVHNQFVINFSSPNTKSRPLIVKSRRESERLAFAATELGPREPGPGPQELEQGGGRIDLGELEALPVDGEDQLPLHLVRRSTHRAPNRRRIL